MIFYKNDKERPRELIETVAFFTLSGAAFGVLFGGSFGLFKGIPLKKILPRTIFRSSAFFGTISAVQCTLEIIRNEKDSFNPLIAGGWTGFIFGHGITRNLKIGLALALNGSLINWGFQAFTFPRSISNILEPFNPILLEEQSGPLKERIESLKSEISAMKRAK